MPTYTPAYLAKVHYDEWIGPARKRPFNRNRFHYNWHWQFEYGNGDTGNQGPHQFDIARWGLKKDEYPVKIRSFGGLFVSRLRAEHAQHPNQHLRVRGRDDPRVRHSRPAHQRRRDRQDRQHLLRQRGLDGDRRTATGRLSWAARESRGRTRRTLQKRRPTRTTPSAREWAGTSGISSTP